MKYSDVELLRQVNIHVGGLEFNMVFTGKADFCNIVCQVLCQWFSNEGINYMLAGGGPGLAS